MDTIISFSILTLMIIVSILNLFILIWSLYELLISKKSISERFLYLAIIIIFNFLGSIVYLYTVYNEKKKKHNLDLDKDKNHDENTHIKNIDKIIE